MVAISQRFSELNPGVLITWDKRSLQAFADEPINQLAERYDFLIMDHPWTGLSLAPGTMDICTSRTVQDLLSVNI